MKKERIYKIFSHMPRLQTERLILRRLSTSDCEDVFYYSRDPQVPKYLLWDPHPNLDYTRQYLDYIAQRYRLGDFYDWALERKSDGRVIGTCGFTSINFHSDSAEVGYVLARDCWGQGYAAEALECVLGFGFDYVGFNRIEAKYMAENPASRRVMEKCSMTFEGVLRSSMKVKGKYRDIGICSILRDEHNMCKNSEKHGLFANMLKKL